MKEKLKTFTDKELIQLANELTLAQIPEDSLIRTLVPNGSPIVFSFIEINAILVQELADRFYKLI